MDKIAEVIPTAHRVTVSLFLHERVSRVWARVNSVKIRGNAKVATIASLSPGHAEPAGLPAGK